VPSGCGRNRGKETGVRPVSPISGSSPLEGTFNAS
jgi:hypothetical protein